MSKTEDKSVLELTKDAPYLALTGELWDVYCEEFGEKWPRYNGTALYVGETGMFRDTSVNTMAADALQP